MSSLSKEITSINNDISKINDNLSDISNSLHGTLKILNIVVYDCGTSSSLNAGSTTYVSKEIGVANATNYIAVTSATSTFTNVSSITISGTTMRVGISNISSGSHSMSAKVAVIAYKA